MIVAHSASSAVAPSFASNHRVNDDTGLAVQDHVAAVADSSGRVFAAWRDARSGDYDVHFATSSDGGKTFSASRRLGGDFASGTRQEKPTIALGPPGTVVVAWQDDRIASFDYDIFASVSKDYGTTFSSPVRVSDGPRGTYQFAPSAAIDPFGNVYVAWQDRRDGDWDIRLSRTTVSSFAFSASVRVDDDHLGSANQSTPSVAVTSTGTVYVAYHDDRAGKWNANAYVAKSKDGGASFAPSVRIDDAGISASAQGLVSLTVDSLGRLYAVWQDNRSGDFAVRFAKSTNGGASFSTSVRVNDRLRDTGTAPRIAVGAAGTLYVVWEEGTDLDWDTYFSYSLDGGATFAPSVQVDDAGGTDANPIPQRLPQVVESTTGLVCVLWQDMRNDNGDIYASTAYLPTGAALRAEVTVRPSTVAPGGRTDITVLVTSNGTGVGGATIALDADYSGSFAAVTDLGSGSYKSSYSPSPSPVTGTVEVTITAWASKAGYTFSGAGQALLRVMPGIVVSLEAPWDTLAVGQSMEVTAHATIDGVPLAGGAVVATASSGASATPNSGTTDSAGVWRTILKASLNAGGTTQMLTVNVSKPGYALGTAMMAITIPAKAKALEIAVASKRWEMMSWETANITVRLTSGGVAVTKALLYPYCLIGGNFSAATDWGGGNYSFTWDAPLVSVQSWVTIGVTAKVGGYVDAKGRLTILLDPNRTNPSNPTQLYLMDGHASIEVPSGQSVLLTIYAYTKEGFVVSGATLKASTLSSSATLGPFSDELNGIYRFSFIAGPVTTDTLVSVKVDGTKYGYARGWIRISLLIKA